MSLLTVDTVPAYVSEHMDKLSGALSSTGTLSAVEVNGGNLNYAFCVKDDEGKSVFVKQAPDFIKCFGPEAKLHKERMELEVKAYGEWRKALGADMSAKFLPAIYHFDIDSMTFIMEFFGSCTLLQENLFDGEPGERVPLGLGEFMGLIHGKTHCSKIPSNRVEELQQQTINQHCTKTICIRREKQKKTPRLKPSGAHIRLQQ